jgi:hypothetical protein
MILKKMLQHDLFFRYLKIILTIFISILVPVYARYYGLQNFLWLSDIGLFLTVASLWLNSILLMSMAAVGVLAVELAWIVDFFCGLVLKIRLSDLTDYMFDNANPIFLRALSFFHLVTPPIWIVYLARYGYERRAVYYFTVIYWIALFATYFFADQHENINWVFCPQKYSTMHISEPLWLLILFVGFPLLIFLPTHYCFTKLFKARSS